MPAERIPDFTDDLDKIVALTLGHYNQCAALKPGGVLFRFNPRDANEEVWNGDRYGVYHELESWRSFMQTAGFVEMEHYYRPDGLPHEQQPWLTTVWRRY